MSGDPPAAAEPETPDGRDAGGRGGIWNALLALPVAFAALAGGTIAYAVVGSVRDALTDPPVPVGGDAGVAAHGTPPALTLVATLAQDLILVAGALLVVGAALGARRAVPALGLRAVARPGAAVGLAIGAYVVFLVVSGVWTTLLGISDRENVAVSLGTRDSTVALVGAMLLVCAAAPMAEELFFRGFLFGALRRYGTVPAALVSGLAFGLAHVASSPIGFIVPLALLGVLLALLYERTGSLYPSIGLHWLNNTIAFAVSDGRGWVLPVVMGVSGLAIVATLALAARGGAARGLAGAAPATA